MKLKPPCRRRSVDALGKRDERDSQRVKFIEQQNQVSKVPTEAVESPDNEHIELPPLRCFQHLIERGPTLLRAGDAVVDELVAVQPRRSQ